MSIPHNRHLPDIGEWYKETVERIKVFVSCVCIRLPLFRWAFIPKLCYPLRRLRSLNPSLPPNICKDPHNTKPTHTTELHLQVSGPLEYFSFLLSDYCVSKSWKDSTELDPATRTNEVREFRRAADRCGYWIEERSGIPLTAANLQSNNVSVDPSREHRLDQAAHELEFTLRLKDVGAERGSDGRPMGRWLREDHCYSRTVIASYDSGSDGS